MIVGHTERLARIRRWIHNHPKKFWTIIVIAVLLIGSVVVLLIINQPDGKPPAQKTPEKTKEVVKYYSPLTGKLVDSEADTKLAVTGVMIENSPNARPQSGLKNSGVVFEAIAEGGITRFLVLYQQEKPQMIGPVRSLRYYDVEWLAAFNAGIAHVGGSAKALREIRNGSYRDLDQFFNSGSYWRSSDRYAPHNVYTKFALLDTLNKSKGYNTSNFTGFSRTDGKAVEKPDATSIDITISSFLYNSTYKYDKKTNTYTRYQAGQLHRDREAGVIKPSVIVALRVNETTVFEDGYRESIVTIGSGKAVIFQNGTAINATWHKATKKSQITFTDTEGNDIPLVRGQTWIAAVPNDKGAVEWQ